MNQKTKNIQKTTTNQFATRRNGINSCLLALSGCAFSLAPLHAGVLFTFSEENGGVVARTSGTIASGWSRPGGNTVGLANTRTILSSTSVRYEIGGAARFTQNAFASAWTHNNDMIGVSVLGDLTGVGSGDAFGFSSNNNFYAPAGTNVGDAITPDTTITWAGETFESLGLDTGLSTSPLVLFTLDNNETISAVRSDSSGVSAIPEPSSMLSLAGLITGSTFLRRRKRA
jgi:hypothetical protein